MLNKEKYYHIINIKLINKLITLINKINNNIKLIINKINKRKTIKIK